MFWPVGLPSVNIEFVLPVLPITSNPGFASLSDSAERFELIVSVVGVLNEDGYVALIMMSVELFGTLDVL